jgi:CrcB protein
MNLILPVAVGGALGAVCRLGIGLALVRWLGPGLPWGTLVVNGLGSFVLGFLFQAALVDPRIGPGTRALVGTGFCGGLTTFSTFSLETLQLPPSLALPNIALNLGVSLGAAWLGIFVVGALRSMAEGV